MAPVKVRDPGEPDLARSLVGDGSVVVAKRRAPTKVGSAVCGSRRLRAALIIIALAAALYVLWSPAAPNYDTAYALLWGRQILNGHLPTYAAAFAPTPHPLLIALGVFVAASGEHAYTLLVLLGCLTWGAFLYGIVRLGDALGSLVGGLVAAVLMATSGLVDNLGVTAEKDLPYVALLIGATTLEVRTRRRGVPVLIVLGLAGLIRPETWLLTGVYWVYLARPLSMTRRLGTLAVAAAPPTIWVLSDLAVTGQPAYSFTHTEEFGEALGRATGLHGANYLLGHQLADIVTWPVLLGGLLAIAWAVRRGKRMLLLPSVIAVLAGLTFVLQGLAELPLTDRLLLALATMLTLLCSNVVVMWTRRWREPDRRPAAVLGLVAVIATLAALPAQERRLASVRRSTQVEGRAYHDLRTLFASPPGARLRSCPRTTVYLFDRNAGAQIPYVLYSLYNGAAGRIVVNPTPREVSGTRPGGLLLEREQSDFATASPPTATVAKSFVNPPAFSPVGRNATWAAWTAGC